jgi:membrane protease YdiL (CAAX protease family)
VELLIGGTLMLAIILLANILYVRNRRSEKLVFDLLLFVVSILVLFLGFLLIIADAGLFKPVTDISSNLLDTSSFGLVLVIMGGAATAVSIGKVRQLIARVMPINPGSPVHALALVLSIYLLGYTALTLSQGGLTGLAESAEPASLSFLILSELIFAVIALFGVGFIVRRRGRDLAERLGLEMPTPVQLLVAVSLIAVLVLLQACAGFVWGVMNPDQSAVLEDVSAVLLTEIDTVLEWFLLALAVGIGEELLFRGALQPALGIGFTSVLFALIHIQYGYTPVTLFIVLVAIVLGLVRRYYSTTITIFIHVGYNFTLGLLALLATYLQDFVAT